MKYSLVFISLLFTLSSCNSFQPDEAINTNSSLSLSPLEISMTEEVNTTTFRVVEFSNHSDQKMLIDQFAFVDNGCGAYSLHSIENSDGEEIYSSGDQLNAEIAPQSSVGIVIRFSPTPCETKEYTTQLFIYYLHDTVRKVQPIHLLTTVNDSTVTITCPEQPAIEYNDQIGDPIPSRKLPSGNYYLKVERMRAFIQPSSGFANFATAVGTDINTESIRDEDLYKPVFLPFSSDGQGNLVLKEIDECVGFALPSSISDIFFWGAKTLLTTPQDLPATIEISEASRIGEINIPDFKINIFADINNGKSLIQSDEGKFSINIDANVTSANTETNASLIDVATEVDDLGDPLLPVISNGSESYLQGQNLYRGSLRVVAVGQFNDTDALMSSNASQALIENEAYIFFEIVAKVVTEKVSP